jgi:hypothetical protein
MEELKISGIHMLLAANAYAVDAISCSISLNEHWMLSQL